jgi:capsular exopolysaccharide synthesis family protein
VVTSAQPREGKTTVSINFSLSLARLGRRVLLVDADLRRPSVHRVFGLKGRGGLGKALRAGDGWQRYVRRDCAPGLDVLPAGAPVAGASELLSSPAMAALLEAAEAEYDFVVVDAPALLINAADARILAAVADGVLLVARSGATPRETLVRALRQVPNVAGVVLNDLDLRLFPPYYRDYGPAAGGDEAGDAGTG